MTVRQNVQTVLDARGVPQSEAGERAEQTIGAWLAALRMSIRASFPAA